MTDYQIHSIECEGGVIRLRLKVGKQAKLASIELTDRQALFVASELTLAALDSLR
jgi:hypothetical protein